MQLSRAVNPSKIKTIQRGVTTCGSATNVTISAVDLSKTIVNISCTAGGVASNYSGLGSVTATATLTNTTNLLLSSYGALGTSVAWEVVEYV